MRPLPHARRHRPLMRMRKRTMSPLRCPLGYPITADGTCCGRHQGLKACRACGWPLDPALTAARIYLHPNCPDPDDTRSQPCG